MTDFWNGLIFRFCKVEFLCWNGDPNWLGWIVLVIVLGIGAFFALLMILSTFVWIGDRFS